MNTYHPDDGLTWDNPDSRPLEDVRWWWVNMYRDAIERTGSLGLGQSWFGNMTAKEALERYPAKEKTDG